MCIVLLCGGLHVMLFRELEEVEEFTSQKLIEVVAGIRTGV